MQNTLCNIKHVLEIQILKLFIAKDLLSTAFSEKKKKLAQKKYL